MMQTLLFPDPRPLVERLGADFFRRAPECPGVYLMRDATDAVLYVGKARNLRKRLCSYRVANPDRMPRRHLRMVRAVVRIELEECTDEPAALAREAELLRSLRPKYNRAGTWPGTPRFLQWRVIPQAVEMGVTASMDPSWQGAGPLGAGADMVRAALLRLLWCAVHLDHTLAAMPHSWFRGRHNGVSTLPLPQPKAADFGCLAGQLEALFRGHPDPFADWVRERTSARNHPFEVAVRDADLETILAFAEKQRERRRRVIDAAVEPQPASPDGQETSPTPDLFSPS